MKSFEVQDVLELLRRDIDRAGGQSEWARQTGIERTLINRVLNGRRLPTSQLCRALGLEWVVVRHVTRRDGQTEWANISKPDFLRILWEEIKKAGSIIAWSKQTGVDRSHLSSVLHQRRPPSKRLLVALNLSDILVCSIESEAPAGGRWRQDRAPGKGSPRARW